MIFRNKIQGNIWEIILRNYKGSPPSYWSKQEDLHTHNTNRWLIRRREEKSKSNVACVFMKVLRCAQDFSLDSCVFSFFFHENTSLSPTNNSKHLVTKSPTTIGVNNLKRDKKSKQTSLSSCSSCQTNSSTLFSYFSIVL